jgi:hypothetical protein
MAEDEFVQVPIPAKYVTKVYGFLAQLDGQTAQEGVDTTPSPSNGPAVESSARENDGGWTEEALRSIPEVGTVSFERLTKIMNELSTNAGRRMSKTELTNATGLARPEMRGALSALTRWLHGNGEGREWPFRRQVVVPSGGGKSETYYWMNPLIASRWRAIQSANNSAD